MKRFSIFLLFVFALSCTCLSCHENQAEAAAPPKRVITVEADTLVQGNDSLPYLLYTVRFEDEQEPLPLIIFFHGAGERGNDNQRQLIHCKDAFLADSITQRHSYRLFIPQCPVGYRWVETDWKLPEHTMPKEPSIPMRMANYLIDSLIGSGTIDTNRIYTAGLSMGGFGVWDLLQRRPNLCAAAIPMCGGGDPAYAPQLTQVALRIYHGALDKAVMPQRSQQMYDAIVKAGGKKAKLTMYPDIAHPCWDRPFEKEAAIDWMFLQTK